MSTLALAQSPLPYAWGYNSKGQLGDGSTTLRSVPVAVTASGVLTGKTLKSVAVGNLSSLALATDGSLFAWGDNTYGQLGNNSSATTSQVPVTVTTSLALSGKTVTAIASGNNHCLALTSSGEVYAWGDNSSGQLGNNSLTTSKLPIAVNVTSGTSALFGKTVIAIAAGASHSLALASDGTVYAWGSNGNGELGINSLVGPSKVPVAVNVANGTSALAGKTVTSIAAGSSFSLALGSDGAVYAWGYNGFGQIGDATTLQRTAPVAVDVSGVLAGKTITSVTAGAGHTVAIVSDGTVVTWGSNSDGQLGNNSVTDSSSPVAVNMVSGTSALAGKTAIAIAAGNRFSEVLASDGAVYTWGRASAGQLGNNTTVQSNVPVAVNVASGTSALAGQAVVSLGSGCFSLHSLVLARPRPVVTATSGPAAGTYTSGAFTFSVTLTFDSAITVTGSPRLTLAFGADTRYATYASGGGTNTLTFSYVSQAADSANVITISPAIDFNGGTLVSGGILANVNFTVPNTSAVHVLAPAAPVFTSAPFASTLNTGTAVTFAVTASGNPAASLTVGSGSLPPGLTLTTGGVLSGTPTTAGSFSGQFSATNSQGSVSQSFSFTVNAPANIPQLYSWGSNIYGQLGNNSTTQSSTPVAVIMSGALAGKTIKGYSAGNRHSLALDSNGAVYAWGQTVFGQSGINTSFDILAPAAVNTGALVGKTIRAVSAGYVFSAALGSDGVVYTWGYNEFGQLGNGSTATTSVPGAVNSGTSNGVSFSAIATGNSHTLALAADGSVQSWGNNTLGQLGNSSSQTSSAFPVTVSLPNVITAIAAGDSHSLALAADGTVYAWGSNNFGQLGDNSTTDRRGPVAVNVTSGISAISGKTIIAIAAGQNHSMALASDGTVYTWGPNYALGNNASFDSAVPVAVNVTNGISALAGKTVTAISASGYTCTALASDGTIYTWGSNNYGLLGNNSALGGLSRVPVAVTTTSALYGQTVVGLAPGGNVNHTLVYARPTASAAMVTAATGPLAGNYVSGSYTFSVKLTYDSPITVAGSPRLALGFGAATRYATYVSGSGTNKLIFSYISQAADSAAVITVPSLIDLNGGTLTGSNSSPADLTFIPPNMSAVHVMPGVVPVFTNDPFYSTLKQGSSTAVVLKANGYPASTFSVASGGLPPGLFLNSTTGLFSANGLVTSTGVYSGTPTTLGTYTGTFAATNSQGTVTQGFTFTVEPALAVPIFTSLALNRPLNVGVLNTYTLTASGGPAPAFSVQSGGLPTGLTLTTAGILSGTPTTPGIFTGSFAATNSQGSATQAFSFTVNAAVPIPQLVSWGENSDGALGNNSTSSAGAFLPVNVVMSGVLAGKNIVSVAVGGKHSLALASDGTVYAWGSNQQAQLGYSIFDHSNVPVAVNTTVGSSALAGHVITAIAAGASHSVALGSDGKVYTWGDNTYGQLGTGTEGGVRLAPVAVNVANGLSALAGKTVIAIAAGASSTMALASDGTVYTWGLNASGQLGNNSTLNQAVPVAVNVASGISALNGKTITAISASGDHCLALASDGTVYAWGRNLEGQLGNTSVSIKSTVPVAVSTVGGSSSLAGKTVTAIVAGGHHSMALASDGSISSWGFNYFGELGNNTKIPSPLPVLVNVASGISSLAGKSIATLAVSGVTSIALASDQSLSLWGSASSGELGNNSSIDSPVPVSVNQTSGLSALYGQAVIGVANGCSSAHVLVLAVPQASPIYDFTAFQNAHFSPAEIAAGLITGPYADPDGDGRVNLLEFALGTDPRSANYAGSTLVLEGNDLVFRFTRPTGGAYGITYVAERSTDLVSWTPTPTVIESSGPIFETLKASFILTTPILVMRLRISQP